MQSEKMQRECDECGRLVSTFSRINNGRHYCSTCYARCFKKRECPGCGTPSRLLARDPAAQCRKCAAARPCLRCHRRGRPLGLILPQGPVCNSCYAYFREPQRCSTCSKLVRNYLRSKPDHLVVCTQCAGSNNKTCSVCRRHRSCTARNDGTWVCRKCESESYTVCHVCQAPVAPGRNGRCEACYWKKRYEANARQLMEFFSCESVRYAFSLYVRWVVEHNDVKRLCSALVRHAEFFAALDKYPNTHWDEAFVLRVFGTRRMRKYELPMRWLQERHELVLTPEAKRSNAAIQTSRKLVQKVPTGSLAEAVLQAFFDELYARVEAGQIKPWSMRMALSPAVSLLLAASPKGAELPNQSTLNEILRSAPGQRAASSTFLKFLKIRYAVELVARKTTSHGVANARKRLGARLSEIANSDQLDSKSRRQWDVTALRYFHRLNKHQAQEIVKTAKRVLLRSGDELHLEGQVFWLPHPPWQDTS